jgi:hypothetical protein
MSVRFLTLDEEQALSLSVCTFFFSFTLVLFLLLFLFPCPVQKVVTWRISFAFLGWAAFPVRFGVVIPGVVVVDAPVCGCLC